MADAGLRGVDDAEGKPSPIGDAPARRAIFGIGDDVAEEPIGGGRLNGLRERKNPLRGGELPGRPAVGAPSDHCGNEFHHSCLIFREEGVHERADVEEVARIDVGETIGAHPLLQGLLLPLFGIALDDSSVGVNDMRGHGDPFRLLRDVEEDSFIVLPLEYLRRPVTVRGGSVDITGDIFKGTGRSDTVIDVEDADRLSKIVVQVCHLPIGVMSAGGMQAQLQIAADLTLVLRHSAKTIHIEARGETGVPFVAILQ